MTELAETLNDIKKKSKKLPASIENYKDLGGVYEKLRT
jgi:hypothetical protein|uniref:Uncharacterized protein n=1 Tax=viral metagenome TaxID=1070528 RepID=A0A6C0D6B4_9ZZZZ